MDNLTINAGDMLFYTSSGDVFDRIIAWWTHSPYVHVAIAISPHEKIEAEGQGIVRMPINGNEARFWPFKSDDGIEGIQDLQEAIAWLVTMVGQPYGWVDVVDSIDLSHKFYFVQTQHYDCSALACQFLIKAGVKLSAFMELNPHSVTPGMLAQFLKVT